jgi:hypothetical protein
MPAQATTPSASSSASSELRARHDEASGESSRTTNPESHIRLDSSSSGLQPTLPISGAVMATICPRYDGSVSTSW